MIGEEETICTTHRPKAEAYRTSIEALSKQNYAVMGIVAGRNVPKQIAAWVRWMDGLKRSGGGELHPRRLSSLWKLVDSD